MMLIILGNKGTLLSFGDYTEIISSVAVNAIDSTVASDAFIEAMFYQIAKNGKFPNFPSTVPL